jgi:hypothetical protein
MNKADEIAMVVGYDSMNALLWTLRRRAGSPTCESQVEILDAASAIDYLVTEVERLTAEVERLSDKIDDLKNVTAWNVALSDAEVAALARGVNPARIRPDAIIDPGRIA